MSWSEPRPTTNNDLEAFVRNMVHSYLGVQTNDAMPTYHVFPTCKPNTEKSNSKSKTEPREASKPDKLDQHCGLFLPCFFAPNATPLWKQTISHENCRPCCTVHFAGGEPVSATSFVRAPLKHLGLQARILFSTSSKSKQSGLHCG